MIGAEEHLYLVDRVRGRPHAHHLGTPIGPTAGGALLHLYEELAHHHGQMQVLRDCLDASRA